MKIRIISLLAFLYCSTACAANGAAHFPLVKVNEMSFIDLLAFSQENRLSYQWDPVAKSVCLKNGSGGIVFRAGSEYVLSKDGLRRLGSRARYFEGAVLVPIDGGRYLEDLIQPAAVSRPLVTGSSVSRVTSKPIAMPAVATPTIKRIVLDAGHGGKDMGAQRGHMHEKQLALEMVNLLRSELETMGFDVMMTRSSDYFIPLPERPGYANKKGADLFVSIHANASHSRSLRGFEVYHLSEATDDHALALERAENSSLDMADGSGGADLSRDVKTIVWDLLGSEHRKESIRLADYVTDEVVRGTDIGPRRVRGANFAVLRGAQCPAVLVEIGYITNREDQKKLMNHQYRKDLARGIAQAILKYKGEYEKTNAYTT